MIYLKSQDEIGKMKAGGTILSQILDTLKNETRPGVSGAHLDRRAEAMITKAGGKPSFKGYRGFPGTICFSINEEVVHGVPTQSKIIHPGDLVSLDIGMKYQGLFTDMAISFGVEPVSQEAKRLITVTEEALDRAIAAVKPGIQWGTVAASIQQYIEKKGFSVVRSLVGHGVGREVHEDPRLPNYGQPKTGTTLEPGMTLAIEPMATNGGFEVVNAPDGFTFVTADGSLAVHAEKTVVVTERGCQILTP